MDKVRIYIQSDIIPLTQVRPVISGDFEFKKESGKLYYRHESKDKFKFDHPDDWALLQPQIADECGEVTVIIDKLCNGSYVRYWEGVFSIFDSTIHYDRCWLEVKPAPMDDYKCFEDALKEEQNIFSSGTTVTVTALGGTLEEQTCTNVNFQADCNDYFAAFNTPDDSCLSDPTKWCLKENKILVDGEEIEPYNCDGSEEFFLEQQTTWHREVALGDCLTGDPPAFGSGWQVLSDDCGTGGDITFWRCPPSTNGLVVGDYTRGRTFEGVLNRVMTNMGCGLTVKSDFFNINPLGDAPSNAAYTYASDFLHNMTVHQKSDIKRKNAQSGSTSAAWDIKTKDFFEDLQKIFNVWYIIDNGVLILEHYSFFTTNLGWDLTSEAITRQVDYGGNENVRSEKYYWSEENSSYSFRSQSIMYDCGTEDKEQRCALFSTDIAYTENPINEEKVSDEGLMLISNALYNGDLIINDNNDPLKWTNLQAALHPYARLYKSGKINNVQQDFISYLPYIKQEKFKTDYCCGQVFDPNDLITTNLTPDLQNGVVDTATHNVFTGRMELELIY